MFNMANLKWELWCYIWHTIKMRAIKCVYCCNWHLSSIMIYLFINSLQNFLQHKVVLHDHQIMKSITINTKNKWYFKVCCALGWWLKFTMQSCFGAKIGFLVAMEKRAVSYTSSIIIEYIFIRPYTNVLECLTYWFPCWCLRCLKII